MSVVLVLSASARALAPSSPIWFSASIIRYSDTNQPARTAKVQFCERCVSLECAREGLGTVITDLVPCPRPLQQRQSTNQRVQERSNVVSVVLVLRAPARAFAPSAPMMFPVHTPVTEHQTTNQHILERFKVVNVVLVLSASENSLRCSTVQYMLDTCNSRSLLARARVTASSAVPTATMRAKCVHESQSENCP